MATLWSPTGGWQGLGLRQDYSADEFASAYPEYTQAQFAGLNPGVYVTDRETSTTISARLSGGDWVEVVKGDKSGEPGWKPFTVNNATTGGIGTVLGGRVTAEAGEQGDAIIKEMQDNAKANAVAAQSLANDTSAFNSSQVNKRQQEADALNTKGSTLNNWSTSLANTAKTAKDGKYKETLSKLDLSPLTSLKNNGIITDADYSNYVKAAQNAFDGYYLQDVISKWDPKKQGAQPPTGGFDSKYYIVNTSGGAKASKQWNDALTSVSFAGSSLPDLDIIARYNQLENYGHWYYTTQGKAAGDRGNRSETAFAGSTFGNAKDWAKAQVEPTSAWYQSLSAADKLKVEKGELFPPEVDEWYKKLSAEEQSQFNAGTLKAPINEADLKGVKGLEVGFIEIPLTDAEYQDYRDQTLGLSDRFNNIKEWADAQDPEVLDEWYKSLPSYQKEEYDAGTLAVPTLDFIPDRLRDKVVMVKGGTTFLEGALAPVFGEKEIEQQKIFASLTTDSLRKAAQKLQAAKKQEQEYDFYKGLPGVSEIVGLNESLANSIIADSGIGGILGIMGDTTKYQENLEDQFSVFTGVPSRNNAIYNWQKWFNDEFVKSYGYSYNEDGELVLDPKSPQVIVTDPLEPEKSYTVDVQFAKDYVDRYLKPRFDQSKSMSEFVSYMDIKQNEQNVFQTQSALDSLRTLADVRAQAYLDGVKASAPLNFDVDFYYNPQGNFYEGEREYSTYQTQREQVSKDWEAAKTQGNTAKVPGTNWTWNQWAYHYGLDLNDKEQFARLHYQVLGLSQGFDPAKDLITQKDAEEYIDTAIIPEIVDEKLNIGDITFLNFVTPEEYADKLLEGISPTENKEEWDKLLEKLGLGDKDLGIEEVKEYIIEAFRTGAAKEIRESIKYLNEKKITPSQKELGVDYIERPEDAKPLTDPGETDLYKVFKDAGYQGSEDDFYNTFMTDIDRSEMELLTQAGKGFSETSAFKGLSSSDPFESMVAIENIFPTSEDNFTSTKEETSSAPSYFKLFEDDKTDEDYKSKTGQKILGEFTSLFKGFS